MPQLHYNFPFMCVIWVKINCKLSQNCLISQPYLNVEVLFIPFNQLSMEVVDINRLIQLSHRTDGYTVFEMHDREGKEM